MLLTFADGQKPQVLSGIKEAKMPFKNYYKFNNSALYVKNTTDENDEDDDDEEEGNFNEMFWKVGVKSFKNFMTELGKVQPRSLVLTKQVLTERGRLELTLEGIQKDLKVVSWYHSDYKLINMHEDLSCLFLVTKVTKAKCKRPIFTFPRS